MHFGEIKTFDIANGEGVRVTLFVSGCRNCCKNCFNKVTWDFNYGNEFNDEVINRIIQALKPAHIKGLSILGGEPFEPENQPELLKLIKEVKKLPNKTIWMYSGFTFEELVNDENCRANIHCTKEILENIDVLVDGRFVEELKDISLRFRGSSNQRIIDVNKTLNEGKVILYNI